MKMIEPRTVNQYIAEQMEPLGQRRKELLHLLSLDKLMDGKNPYFLQYQNVMNAPQWVANAIEAFLSPAEEKLFDEFLAGLAIFVAEQTFGGYKSSTPGMDLEFSKNGIDYVVSIQSGHHQSTDQSFSRAVLWWTRLYSLAAGGRS